MSPKHVISIMHALLGCATVAAYEWVDESNCKVPAGASYTYKNPPATDFASCKTACLDIATDPSSFNEWYYTNIGDPDTEGDEVYSYGGDVIPANDAPGTWCCNAKEFEPGQGPPGDFLCNVYYFNGATTETFIDMSLTETFIAKAFLFTLPLQIGAGGDPHMLFPHGGKADFKGRNNTYFNFLSAMNFSLSVLSLFANFSLHDETHPKHKHVRGSFLTEAHMVARTNTSKTVRVSLVADAIGKGGTQIFVNGSVDGEPFKMGPRREKVIGNLVLNTTWSSLRVLNPEFDVTLSTLDLLAAYRGGVWSKESWGTSLERNVTGAHHRLDLQIKLRVPEDKLALPPHGIIGQHWDGDGKAIDGEEDVFPYKGEFTTYAMAKGALEGVPDDYVMADKYATAFKFSRFDATSAKPRDVAKLVAAGVLNAPKDRAAAVEEDDFVGATERTATQMEQREL